MYASHFIRPCETCAHYALVKEGGGFVPMARCSSQYYRLINAETAEIEHVGHLTLPSVERQFACGPNGNKWQVNEKQIMLFLDMSDVQTHVV